MFPLLSCLFPLFGLPLHFSLGKLTLPLLALEKGLYLREQDAGQSLYLIVGYPGAIVVGFLLAWHGITPLEPFLLTEEKLALMLPKMDDYCKQQLGCSLEECCAQYLEETKDPAPIMQM